jgi:hypothetical protein
MIARLHAKHPDDREFLDAVLRQIKSLAAAARKAVEHAKRPIE